MELLLDFKERFSLSFFSFLIWVLFFSFPDFLSLSSKIALCLQIIMETNFDGDSDMTDLRSCCQLKKMEQTLTAFIKANSWF